MLIGVPKEIKTHENRVALLPSGVTELLRHGHQVMVQKDAGLGSGFPDDLYKKAGATIIDSADDIWEKAEMIMKVKEPIEQEYHLMRDGQIIFTYFHFAASQELTEAVKLSGAIAIAYETVEKLDGSLPLLIPMSEVAGRMATQEGAKYLERPMGGRGVLLGGIPGVRPGNVMVLGGGIVGVNAARMAAGLGANVTIYDISLPKLRYLDEVLPANITTMFSSTANIRNDIANADLVIGAVLIPGAKAPKLVTRDMLSLMKPGAVLVDVAIDQGGCFETSKATTHEHPTYVVDNVVHYCVANMPGAVPYTSTIGLTNVTLPYAVQIANKGWVKAIRENRELEFGLNIANGKIVYRDVAEAFDLEWTPLTKFLSSLN
ncbi:L-alanine dehydrogenase [Cyclonatronum proteinivorum]|uniref:Alanine dehydrogenase n=1 Tax=Cyclonatronum proteinivorum TaxID=1457365 RepID=A0A345UKJ9_9BACT|nr:alanine dehydrogenase [Cyclonatronum proteinivorum]AXJ01001.1 L-alanine dehydrogenase [Cyclonatronum proteinivorum]